MVKVDEMLWECHNYMVENKYGILVGIVKINLFA